MEYYAAIKRTSYTCNNMNEFEKYYIEQKKPEWNYMIPFTPSSWTSKIYGDRNQNSSDCRWWTDKNKAQRTFKRDGSVPGLRTITWVYIFVKTHGTIYLTPLSFIVCKLFLWCINYFPIKGEKGHVHNYTNFFVL